MDIQPFKFGVATSGEHFTDRREDTQRLASNFKHGINTILISPRRWGKTSLVKKTIKEVSGDELRVIFLDIFACRTESDFCNAYATAVLQQTATRWEEILRNAKEFLSRISPKFTLGTDPTTEISLSLDIRGKEEGIEDVLELPEKIAKKNNCRIVVCIDEFQQLGEFTDSLTFQKKLRSVWQHQRHVSYCLFGSKRHLMSELFGSRSYPFYKFGEVIYLSKIGTSDWVTYICERFASTGKSISPALAEEIALRVDNHSSYVQQLSWLVWSRSDSVATASDIEQAESDLISQNSPLFEKQTEDLTGYQLSLLRAITDGVHGSFTSQEVIDKYGLSSSANANSVRNALIKKEVIETTEGQTYMTDPVMALWMKRSLF